MLKTFLVEDNPAELAKIREFLTQRCPTVQIVGTAGEMQEAYEGILQSRPDLLISDIRIIGGHCYDLLARLRQQNRLRGLRIIFMTGFREFELVREGYEYAPVAFLEKPCTGQELQEAVEKVERQNQSPQALQQVEMLLDLIGRRPAEGRRLAVPLVGGSVRMLEVSDIVYLQSDGGVARLYMKGSPNPGDFLASNKPLSHFRALLQQDSRFFQVGNGELVNLDHLEQYDHGERLLRFGNPARHFYASRSGARALREHLAENPVRR